MMKSDAEIWATTTQNVVVLVIIGGAWLVGKVDSLVAIPALLACAGIDIRSRMKGKRASGSVGPLVVMAGSVAAQALLHS